MFEPGSGQIRDFYLNKFSHESTIYNIDDEYGMSKKKKNKIKK